MAVGALLTLPSLVVVALVGRFVNDVQLGLGTWVALVGVLWAGSIAFVALGLLIGLSLDEKAAGGAMSFVGVVLALLGGLWVPVEVFPRVAADDGPRHAVVLVRRAGPGRRRRLGPAVEAVLARARVHRSLRRPGGARGPAASAVRGRRLSRATVPHVERRNRSWQQPGAGRLPWLLFQPSRRRPGDHPAAARGAHRRRHGLVVFTVAYLDVFGRAFHPGRPPAYRELAVVAVLGVTLAVTMGTAWAGLMIYVSAAAPVTLPERWVWPAVLGATAVCAAVVASHDLLGDVFILPVMCVLTAFALPGTRYLVSVNAELVEARDELARNAVAEERLRFARDLHDLLGHSLSLIALKSELAGRLAEIDPAGAGGDGRRRGRRAPGAGRGPRRRQRLPAGQPRPGARRGAVGPVRRGHHAALAGARGAPAGAVDAVLGWVVREATTNVLRHSAARVVTVRLERTTTASP